MAPVILHVYDISEYNSTLLWFGLGIFHSGVEVHGLEYAFGAHEFDTSGMFATNPREAPGEVSWRCSIHIGDTDLTPQQVHQLVLNMGKHYTGKRYHLLQTNCNHFSSDFCFELCRRRPPGWVNRLAGLVVALHCLLPPNWVPALVTPSMPPDYGVNVPRPSGAAGPAPVKGWSRRREQAYYHATSRADGDTQSLLSGSAGALSSAVDPGAVQLIPESSSAPYVADDAADLLHEASANGVMKPKVGGSPNTHLATDKKQ